MVDPDEAEIYGEIRSDAPFIGGGSSGPERMNKDKQTGAVGTKAQPGDSQEFCPVRGGA